MSDSLGGRWILHSLSHQHSDELSVHIYVYRFDLFAPDLWKFVPLNTHKVIITVIQFLGFQLPEIIYLPIVLHATCVKISSEMSSMG